MYQYVAFDTTTGCGSTICKRKERLLKTQFHSLIGDILYSIKYTGDRRHVKNYTLAPEEFIEIVFRRIMPSYGYAVREEQIRMARTMYEGLTHKMATCCEAEVGTGKTLAYLVAGLAAKMFNQTYKHTGYPVTIATSSIELQKAIMENEIPMLSKMLMEYGIIKKPLTAVLRKGKEHYFCIARYNDFFKGIHNHPEKNEDLIALLKKERLDLYGFDLDKVTNLPARVKARANVKGNCNNCPQWIGCRYYQHLAEANTLYEIDFQITNHNMYLMNLQMGFKLLLPCNYCIIDEAHKLAETAAQVFGCEIESGAVDKFLNAVCYSENPKLISRPNFKSALAEAAYFNHKLFEYLKIEAIEGEDDGEMQKLNFNLTVKIQDTMAHLCSCLQRVQALVEDEPKYKGLHCSSIISALERFKQPEKLLYWLTLDKSINSLYLCCAPRNIEDRMFSLLWNDGNRSTVLTSGTMRDDTGFDFFKSENGLNRLEKSKVLEASCSSPFIFGEGVSDRMVRGIHAMIRKALEKANNEGLIPTNPAIGCKIPPKKAREMEILTHEEIQRFIIQAAYDGYYELFLLEFATGMRRGEICGLQWIDLDFDSGELKIRRQVVSVDDGVIVKKPKTKGSVRTVILDASLLRVLYELKQKSESQWIFPSPVKNDSPLNPQTVYRKTQQILERAQCKKVRFHDLRHTFATMSLENGMDIKTLSNMIGHSSVATTLDIYSHITDEMLKNASRTIDRGIGKANSRPENEIEITMKKEVAPPPQVDFEAYKGKIRKSGTGGIYKLNDHLYEGRYTPTNAYGKRESCNVYAKTYEECEVKLEEMIAKKRAEIAAEKERLKAMQTA